MTTAEHSCKRCSGWRLSIREHTGEITHLLRVAEKKPGTPQAINSLARVPMLKERLSTTRQELARHLSEVSA